MKQKFNMAPTRRRKAEKKASRLRDGISFKDLGLGDGRIDGGIRNKQHEEGNDKTKKSNSKIEMLLQVCQDSCLMIISVIHVSHLLFPWQP